MGVHVGSLGALDAEYQTITTTIDAFTGTATAGTQALDAATAESVESIKAQMVELTAAYDAAYAAAYDGISNTINGFDEMAATVPTDIQTVINAFDTQSGFMDTYLINLGKAADMGLDEGLLRALSDGSVESAKILAGIVEDGGTHIDDLNAEFLRVEQGKKDFATPEKPCRVRLDG